MTIKDIDLCEDTTVHTDVVENARADLIPENLTQNMADFFKVLGEPTRIKIIQVLLKRDMCVCDLAETLNSNQPAISQHLKTLKLANMVKYHKDGKNVIYSISDDHVTHIFDQCLVHIKERSTT